MVVPIRPVQTAAFAVHGAEAVHRSASRRRGACRLCSTPNTRASPGFREVIGWN